MGAPLQVGVRRLDLDAELWIKVRLVPTEPYVGSFTWAFANKPRIKLVLAPFRFVNLMNIPLISSFLLKLLTEDLPRNFELPNKVRVGCGVLGLVRSCLEFKCDVDSVWQAHWSACASC
jgi:Ca2+-dependent lipid-binding protein